MVWAGVMVAGNGLKAMTPARKNTFAVKNGTRKLF